MKLVRNKYAIWSTGLFIVYLLIFLVEQLDFAMQIVHNIQFVSIMGIVLITFIVFSWKMVYYRFLCPYIVFVFTLYLTLCGQSFLWAFGLKAGYRDLQTAKYKTISFASNDICRALLFSYICILIMHSIVLNSVNAKTKKTCEGIRIKIYTRNNYANRKENVQVNYKLNRKMYSILVWLGIMVVAFSIVPYVRTSYQSYLLTRTSGYGVQYENVTYGLSSALSKIGDFLPLGIISLFYAWAVKNEYKKKNHALKAISIYMLILFHIIMELMLSQRTEVILFAIAILFVFFNRRKIPFRFFVFGIIFGIILMAGMRMVDLLRSGDINSFSDFILYATAQENNPVFDFLGDIGWNLMTTIEFQKVIPGAKNYGFGFSYLVSMTSLIPNINFWTIHPAYQLGNISGWLQDYLGFSFGIGCTPVAEAYYNFGMFGWIVFILWGKFILSMNRKFENEYSILDNYQVVLFMGILLKSAVRSSFFAFFRPYFLFVFLPVFIIKQVYKLQYSLYKKSV